MICFPGVRGCRRLCDDTPVDQPETQRRLTQRRKERSAARAKQQQHRGGGGDAPGGRRVGLQMQIGSTSIIPIKGADRFRLDESELYDSGQ